jgi:hypothetical protein
MLASVAGRISPARGLSHSIDWLIGCGRAIDFDLRTEIVNHISLDR